MIAAQVAVQAAVWPQPLAPLSSLGLSALVATVPLAVVMVLMGVFRKGGLFASACGFATVALLALTVWKMPAELAGWSVVFGFATAAWSILWLVFNALWLYKLAMHTGSFDKLKSWLAHHASGDPCVQVTLVAFCFGALLEGSAGFGAPVAITAFLLVGLGFPARKAVLVSLIANTAPVAFGSVGVPIIALASVTTLDVHKLSEMVGRQLPFLSAMLPAYLVVVVGGWSGLKRTWPVAIIAGVSFGAAQFAVSNFVGPEATDVLSALTSIVATVSFLQVWSPRDVNAAAPPMPNAMPMSDVIAGWVPWALLASIIVVWSFLKIPTHGATPMPIHHLHNGITISFNQKPYGATFNFQPLATGTAVLLTAFLTALWFRVRPGAFVSAGYQTFLQLRLPGLAVLFIVGLAYLYNYSGMVYTLASALAGVGGVFPLVSSFLGWIACFLTGSDTSSNILFGNLQVATAQQLHLNPVLLAATNSSGAVAGKMISPQNITIGVTTVGLSGHEGEVLRGTFWHSIVFAAFIGLIACAQAYVVPWMVP